VEGILASTSDLCCVLAVDNIIANERDFFSKLARPFVEKGVGGAFPMVIYDKKEPLINKYITERAEPFTEFIYMNACNSRTFHKVYPVAFRNEAYTIFDFKGHTPPLLALAQGFTVRRDGFTAKPQNRGYDLLPVLDLIGAGSDIAYVENAMIYHRQIMSMRSFIRKFRWRIRMNLAPGVLEKKLDFFSPAMKLRRILWAIYTASLVGPLIYSVYRSLAERKIFYFYHFVCNEILLILLIWEYTSFKFSGGKGVKTYK
jgi:GT2 family glycosyltransferase